MEEIEDMASIAKAMEYLSSDPSILDGTILLDSSEEVKSEVATQNRENKVSAEASQPVAPPTTEKSNISGTEDLANEVATTPPPTTPEISSEQSVPNTYRDLHD